MVSLVAKIEYVIINSNWKKEILAGRNPRPRERFGDSQLLDGTAGFDTFRSEQGRRHARWARAAGRLPGTRPSHVSAEHCSPPRASLVYGSLQACLRLGPARRAALRPATPLRTRKECGYLSENMGQRSEPVTWTKATEMASMRPQRACAS